MAKVVLVWNEHPTEVVAGFHARKVAKILREKYGHEVVMEKIPASETTTGILGHAKTPKTAWKKLAKLPSSNEITERFAEKHNAQCFNFHASHYDVMHDSHLDPENFRVSEVGKNWPERGRLPSPITFSRESDANNFVIEIPAFFDNLPKIEVQEKKAGAILDVFEEGQKPTTEPYNQLLPKLISVMKNLREVYHTERTPLSHPSQQKYLHPAISEKIAAAIHERISRK